MAGAGGAGGRRARRILLLLALTVAAMATDRGAIAAGQPSPSTAAVGRHTAQVRSSGPPTLDALLDVMERVAALYRDSALGFVASERILWTDRRRTAAGSRFGRMQRERSVEYDYFYVAEETPAGTQLRDYRTPRNDPDGDRVELAQTELPGFILRPYSWVFVFLASNRTEFEFVLEAEGKAQDRPAHVLRFGPASTSYQRGINDAFGRVWIDPDTHGLLRVDAVRSDGVMRALEEASLAEEDASAADTLEEDARFEFHAIRVDFGEERSGLRFPTRAQLQFVNKALPEAGHAGFHAAAWEVLERGIAGSNRIDHRFSDYRFFSVRTGAEVQEIIRGVRVRQ